METRDLIAITSVAARCAGADDADEYWNLLQAARPQFCEVPADRWTPRHTDSRPGHHNRSYSHVMAPLQDPYAFDAKRFRIPRSRAKRMDPQQRLGIGLAEELFTRADTDVRSSSGGRIATIIGVSSTDYRAMSSAPILAELTVDGSLFHGDQAEKSLVSAAANRAVLPINGHTMPGVLANMVPSSIQSVFELNGPAFSVDSACASSLTALDIGCSMVAQGRVDACVTGGVYTALTPEAQIGFAAIGALSPTGVCRPFTDSADGFVMGEGGALILLRRLSDAIKNAEPILGVIEAVGASNDGGAAPGVMTPTISGQVAAIRESLDIRGESEMQVDAVEGHGTGTVIGDRVELETLREVAPKAPVGSMLLGSLKAIVGHTMAASGALGVVKALLALDRQVWPGQPASTEDDWHQLLPESPYTLSTDTTTQRPLERVAVNSFGFGGTNCHVVIAKPTASSSPGSVD